MSASLNTVHHQDCIEGMAALPAGSVDLAFADPPFNIGYEYDVYDDARERDHYLDWSKRWIAAVHRVLKPDGTFWLAIGDEYAAELKLISRDLGFQCRSWVVWYYTFGVNCKFKFTRSHAHLFYFVKDPAKFTWRGDVPENRIPSARQLVYADSRANPKGRFPDDTWILRPQDATDSFTPMEDTWYFPRVAGTFKERAGFHGCQMPEQLMGRIIRFCSEPGELVLDPFSGSAVTLAVAKKLGRKFVGFDLSKDYAERGRERLESVCVGDSLDGSAEPVSSAPQTPVAGRRGKQVKANKAVLTVHPAERRAEESYLNGLIAGFDSARDGWSLDRVVADPEINARLAETCRAMGLPGDAFAWNTRLFALRKAGRLADRGAEKRTDISWQTCDRFLFASEIALRTMLDEGFRSLDEILCDPQGASRFDSHAAALAPGFTSLEYRWGALKLRKDADVARRRADLLAPRGSDHFRKSRLRDSLSLDDVESATVPDKAGLYVVQRANDSESLYVGECLDLRARMRIKFGDAARRERWRAHAGNLVVRFAVEETTPADLRAYQCIYVRLFEPKLNCREFAG